MHVPGSDDHRWLLLALCRAISHCGTTTGHFAQALTLKPANAKKFAYQRQRSVWREWVAALEGLTPRGSKQWRRQNIAFRGDALSLLDSLQGAKKKPSVIYADPPYTSDQYSRYYHLYETLILYDYPVVSGKGLYVDSQNISRELTIYASLL
jgi:adenine-specific DNA-methyltransferase